jgi:hypothetical protein
VAWGAFCTFRGPLCIFFSLLDLLVKCVELPNICVGSFLKKKKSYTCIINWKT